ncbi:MAG TPA: hypothetical protein PLS53_01515 [Thermoanaerobaculaceae bacterium]|nr:hypothetical protein [Thermoanaerobaculaceae bacterium]HPS76814.1 hypothetical protein [Thermoanaerobaculaceae bacterium]
MTDEAGTGRERGANVLRALALGAAVLVLLWSRAAARQLTPWEWDDLVFRLSLEMFAPQSQVPQAPFYPGFVLLGRLAHLLVGDLHAALTWVSVAASVLAPLLLAGVARELGLTRRAAVGAGTALAFLPAVWLHAGVPLSDPAGLAAGLGALWLALVSRRDPRWLIGAALALGPAFAMRPQATLPAVIALGSAIWQASWPRRLGAGAAAIGGVLGCYALPLVVAARGVSPLWSWTRYQAGFVVGQESLVAHHWAIATALRHHLLDIWGSPVVAVVVMGLAFLGASALARTGGWRAIGWPLVLFAPYAVLAVVFLDPPAAGRYALPYLPLTAVLVGAGAEVLDRRLPRSPVPATASLLAAIMGLVTWPAIRVVQARPSPAVEAAGAIRAASGTAPVRVLFGPSMLMHAHAWFAPGKLVAVRGPEERCSVPLDSTPTWLYGITVPGGHVAAWPEGGVLSRVSRGRYLRVGWSRVDEACVWFGEGYFPEERTADAHTFRWMGEQGLVRFQPAQTDLHLDLEAAVPIPASGRPPHVTIALNGEEVAEATAHGLELVVGVPLPAARLHGDRDNELLVTTSETAVPAGRGASSDRRRLGLQVRTVAIRVVR